mgnify:FL=1
MKREIKHFDTIVGVTLIILTAISLIIDAIAITHGIYSDSLYHMEKLDAVIRSNLFQILFWVDNLLIYLFAFLNILSAIDTKKERLLKISFSIFSVLTTIVVITLSVDVVGNLFGIFS